MASKPLVDTARVRAVVCHNDRWPGMRRLKYALQESKRPLVKAYCRLRCQRTLPMSDAGEIGDALLGEDHRQVSLSLELEIGPKCCARKAHAVDHDRSVVKQFDAAVPTLARQLQELTSYGVPIELVITRNEQHRATQAKIVACDSEKQISAPIRYVTCEHEHIADRGNRIERAAA